MKGWNGKDILQEFGLSIEPCVRERVVDLQDGLMRCVCCIASASDMGTRTAAPLLKMLHPVTLLAFALTQGSGIPGKLWSQGRCDDGVTLGTGSHPPLNAQRFLDGEAKPGLKFMELVPCWQ